MPVDNFDLVGPSCHHISAEVQRYAASIDIPIYPETKPSHSGIRVDSVAHVLVANFLKVLRKAEVTDLKKTKYDVIRFRCPDGVIASFFDLLARKVHKCFEPLITWREEEVAVALETYIEEHKHYHLVPAEIGRERHTEFMYWDGLGPNSDYFDGLPGEWKAYRELEEAVKEYLAAPSSNRILPSPSKMGSALYKLDYARR
jgi:hypothetical protein